MFSSLSKFKRQIKNRKKTRKWWLFHATDFQLLMYPCFTFFRILAIFPYKMSASSFETSKPRYFLSTIITCIFGFLPLIMIIDASRWYGNLNDRRNIEFICLTILSNIIIVMTFVLNGPRMRLLETIRKISSKLPSEMYRKQSVFIHSKDIFGFFYLLIYAMYSCYYTQINIVFDVCFFYNTVLVYQMDMLYINCVCVLKVCFKRINDDLANLLISNKSHVIKWIDNEHINLLLMELKALKKQHLMVSDTVKKLNIIFSPHLLATTAYNFIFITFEMYFKFVYLHNELSSWTNQVHRISIPYIACLTVKIALTAWACETGKNQAKEISTTVHDVLNSTNNEKIKNELRVFSLQILHSDNTFCAKGLTVDATLLTDMMGTVTTYILILIQFLNT
ncbi:uncharacterized protein LOC113003121 [Solenopsis invicta]|uniref:uncharacterized protein LOC113003121 n=1 Tax=Solenopsis invicta TaxID=13686 RepID=UPI00193CE8A9|nr:uncharacterized protein LOC113003121 [Solenopsis invicta]